MAQINISVINSDKFFDQDRLFDTNVGTDNGLYQFQKIKELANQNEMNIHTSDILPPEKADIIIFMEVPDYIFPSGRNSPLKYPDKKCFLMLFECSILRPNNFNKRFHLGYERIFTWDDDLIATNPNLYTKLVFAQRFDIRKVKPMSQKNNFMVCVNGNKKISAKGELYSERVKVISFYEKKYPELISVYGSGWHEFRCNSNKVFRPLNYIFRRLPKIKYLRTSYKGFVDDKISLLDNFKFNLCFENYSGQNGYITEKIFHSFAAGCIPIYWGPNNIENYIPKSTFIDYRQFKNVMDCHQYISNLSENQLENYQLNILDFTSSQSIDLFRADTFAIKMINELRRIL